MADWQTGRIIRALSGFYTVSTPAGLVECKARGHFRKEHCTPLVGDVAEISVTGKTGMVERLAPRHNSFVRPAVANIDCLVLLAANVNPVTDPFLLDRVAAIAGNQNVPVAICINKCDLDPGAHLADIYRRAGFPTWQVSAKTGQGIAEVASFPGARPSPSPATPASARAACSTAWPRGWGWLSGRSRRSWAAVGIRRGMWSYFLWAAGPTSPIPPVFPPLIRTRWT